MHNKENEATCLVVLSAYEQEIQHSDANNPGTDFLWHEEFTP